MVTTAWRTHLNRRCSRNHSKYSLSSRIPFFICTDILSAHSNLRAKIAFFLYTKTSLSKVPFHDYFSQFWLVSQTESKMKKKLIKKTRMVVTIVKMDLKLQLCVSWNRGDIKDFRRRLWELMLAMMIKESFLLLSFVLRVNINW